MRLREVQRLEAIDTDEVDAGAKLPNRARPESSPLLPEERAELEADEADLLVELAAQRLIVVFTLPPGPPPGVTHQLPY